MPALWNEHSSECDCTTQHIFLSAMPALSGLAISRCARQISKVAAARKYLWVLFVVLTACEHEEPPARPTAVGLPAPELTGALTWINSIPVTLAELRGKVVLIDFFEYSCVNCIRTFPYLKEWQRRYAPFGFAIVGVHTPQYGFSMDPVNVFAGITRLGLTFPVAVDSEFQIADAYQNRFWPRVFLVDKEGKVRFDHTGEGAYEEIEATIQRLIREINPDAVLPQLLRPMRAIDRPGAVCQPITPELYLGKTRGQLANFDETSTNAVVTLRLPDRRDEGRIYADGEWSNQSEYLRHAVDKDELVDSVSLKYRAVELNVVMKPEEIFFMLVFVKQDDEWLRREIAGEDIQYDEEGRSFVRVDAPRMYNLIANQPYGTYEARLYVRGKGLSLYSFSFGTCEITPRGDTLRSAKEGL